MLKNERGHYLNSNALMPKLGYKSGGHLPREGFEPRRVEGVMFKCIAWSEFKPSANRVYYLCEECHPGQWVPFGRASQHKHKGSPPSLASIRARQYEYGKEKFTDEQDQDN